MTGWNREPPAIRVDKETDRLITHASHFLGVSKKTIVENAVREYVDAHRDEIEALVAEALRQLTGDPANPTEEEVA